MTARSKKDQQKQKHERAELFERHPNPPGRGKKALQDATVLAGERQNKFNFTIHEKVWDAKEKKEAEPHARPLKKNLYQKTGTPKRTFIIAETKKAAARILL